MGFEVRSEIPGLDPEAKRALVEVQTSIKRELDRAEVRGARPKRRVTELTEEGHVIARPGEVVRVQPSDTDITVYLPEPGPANGGEDIVVSFEGDGTATGKVLVANMGGTCALPGVTTLNSPGQYRYTSVTSPSAKPGYGSPTPSTGAGTTWSGPPPIVADDLPEAVVLDDELGGLLPGAPIYDVMRPPFNAVGDGVADDTAAINAAIVAANAVSGHIHLGLAHKVTSALTAVTGQDIFIVGRGPRSGGTRIFPVGATPFDVFTLSFARGCGLKSLITVGPGTWASTGRSLFIDQCFLTRVIDCEFNGTYGAAEVFASVITEFIRSYASAILGPHAFYAHGSAAVGENHALTFNACACGTDVTSGAIAWYHQGSYCHTFELINCGALTGGYGLLVEDDDPGVASEPKFTRTVNFQADHNVLGGIRLLGGAAGRFTHSFITSVSGGNAVHIASTYGGNWEFNGGEISGIGGHGIYIGKGDGTVIGMQIGNLIAGKDGIFVDTGVTDFNLLGNSCGDMYEADSVFRYGISIASGCDNYVVVGNRCIGNTTGAILNTPGTSATRVMRNNIPIETFVQAVSLAPGTYNNYAIDSRAEILQVTPSSAGDVIFTGFLVDGGNSGRRIRLIQNGLVGRVLVNNNSGSSTSGNRIINANLIQLVLELAGAGVDITYNDSSLFWYTGREPLKVRKNSTGTVFTRERLNLIEGTGVTITMADDSTTNEVDITIAGANMAQSTIKGRASGAGTGDPTDLTATQVATILAASLTGRLIARTFYASGSGTHTYNAATTRAVVRMKGGGGGGGGVEGGAVPAGSAGGGGGGSGAELVLDITSAPSTSAYAVGAAGTGVSGLSGTNGGDTTFHDGTATRTAVGGSSGVKGDLGTTSNTSQGGGGGALPGATGAFRRGRGEPGQPAYTFSLDGANFGNGGHGGGGMFGGGGYGRASVEGDGNGETATSPGAGGGGAYSDASTTDRAGGDGCPGGIEVEEYS